MEEWELKKGGCGLAGELGQCQGFVQRWMQELYMSWSEESSSFLEDLGSEADSRVCSQALCHKY